jgi:hypothetical protein
MKTKEMNEIISQCEPLAMVIFETSEKSEHSLKMLFKNLKKIKPTLSDFVNRNQGRNQEIYLKLDHKKQCFCDDIEGLCDSITELQELVKEEGDEIFCDEINFDDVRDSFFSVMSHKK